MWRRRRATSAVASIAVVSKGPGPECCRANSLPTCMARRLPPATMCTGRRCRKCAVRKRTLNDSSWSLAASCSSPWSRSVGARSAAVREAIVVVRSAATVAESRDTICSADRFRKRRSGPVPQRAFLRGGDVAWRLEHQKSLWHMVPWQDPEPPKRHLQDAGCLARHHSPGSDDSRPFRAHSFRWPIPQIFARC